MRPRPDRLLDYREFPVLYVDDEVENLRIFELTFRREFKILTASSGDEALEILQREPIAIVLSDQKMPAMVGTEFLKRVREIDPKTIRVLVTAYGDADTLSSAINNGSIYRFVPKPWVPEDMRATLRRGIEVYALDREKEHLVRELTLLNGVSRSISRELDQARLISLLLETITSDFGYDAAAMLLLCEGGNRLRLAGVRPEDHVVEDRLKGIDISGRTAPRLFAELGEGLSRSVLYSECGRAEGPVRQWVTEIAAEEVSFVPLVGGNGLVGVFVIDNRRGGESFGADDHTLLEGLASQAAIALENARLVEDLRRSKEQVMRFDRLGTLGTLAAGLAHEINNPLVSIRTFLSMAPAKRREDDEEFWSNYHALAAGEVERITRLVDTMRQLGRQGSSDAPREMVDLGAIAEQVRILVANRARRAGVEIGVRTEDGVPKIAGVRDHLHQLLMNLLLNAIDATPEAGSVTLGIMFDAESDRVRVEVADTGPGIADEDIERIFDPFFTTKDPDKGTGLGLMICHRIVTDHGGAIEVASRGGAGATFTVTLPSAPAKGQ